MCDKCDKYSEHIADLRNKVGSSYTFYQMKKSGFDKTHPETFAKIEAKFMEHFPKFIELLKSEISD